jgi:hypothetical protein
MGIPLVFIVCKFAIDNGAVILGFLWVGGRVETGSRSICNANNVMKASLPALASVQGGIITGWGGICGCEPGLAITLLPLLMPLDMCGGGALGEGDDDEGLLPLDEELLDFEFDFGFALCSCGC